MSVPVVVIIVLKTFVLSNLKCEMRIAVDGPAGVLDFLVSSRTLVFGLSPDAKGISIPRGYLTTSLSSSRGELRAVRRAAAAWHHAAHYVLLLLLA